MTIQMSRIRLMTHGAAVWFMIRTIYVHCNCRTVFNVRSIGLSTCLYLQPCLWWCSFFFLMFISFDIYYYQIRGEGRIKIESHKPDNVIDKETQIVNDIFPKKERKVAQLITSLRIRHGSSPKLEWTSGYIMLTYHNTMRCHKKLRYTRHSFRNRRM